MEGRRVKQLLFLSGEIAALMTHYSL